MKSDSGHAMLSFSCNRALSRDETKKRNFTFNMRAAGLHRVMLKTNTYRLDTQTCKAAFHPRDTLFTVSNMWTSSVVTHFCITFNIVSCFFCLLGYNMQGPRSSASPQVWLLEGFVYGIICWAALGVLDSLVCLIGLSDAEISHREHPWINPRETFQWCLFSKHW